MNKSSIYIHVPWCKRRCPYCNFYLVVGRPQANFIDALMSEWEYRGHLYQHAPATSLYFGGGTPSLLAPEQIGQLIKYFFDRGALANDAEITIEVNPEDISLAYAEALARTGVNRISMGVQSFDDAVLRYLGRKHTAAMAKTAIAHLKSFLLHNISVDLIVGMGNERLSAIGEGLLYLNDMGVEHVSAYLLTIEEDTTFYKRIRAGSMQNPPEEKQVEAFRYVQDRLEELGYVQYDISSYAKNNRLSRHNQLYWAAENYVGLGPGAHSMRLLPHGGVERAHNRADLKHWLVNQRDPHNWAVEYLEPHEALAESLAFGLRNMVIGIEPALLSKRHNSALPDGFLVVVEKLKNFGWLEETERTVRITKDGSLFADAVMRDILCC